jgi:uncharacterized repeat protein (TIGR01451 family)
VTDQTFGLVFDYDMSADCACGSGDSVLTQRAIIIDGDMTDWGAVLSDLDNNACDEADSTDRDYPVPSTGRNLVRTTITQDASYFAMLTQRVGHSKNTQNFIYYSDTNSNGWMEDGEPVVVALWQGNTGNVDLRLYSYDDLGTGPHALLDANGYADGYNMPGDLNFVKNLPAGSGRGSTSGDTAGVQMEWRILWSDLGVAFGSAISWHSSSTNTNPGSAGIAAQIDDNMGGCGGQCAGSNQFGGVDWDPVNITPGQTVYLAHQLTNTGNGDDYFNLTSASTGDFSPLSVTYYLDLGTLGEFDNAVDVLFTDTNGDGDVNTGIIAAGESINILVAVEIPGPPVTGAMTLTVFATSKFAPGCGGTVIPVSGDISVTISMVWPNIITVKSVTTLDDPVNGTVNPKAIPGASMLYTIVATNQGTGVVDADTVVITDQIPANTALFVGDLDGNGSPVSFIDGATSSGLSYSFTSLASTTDDMEFSNNDGASYTYDPGPDADADGFNSSVTHLRVRPKGVFYGASGGNNPSFELKFKVRME